MSLRLVGSGFGRTGTYSLKLALETLGLGPCHHMSEVFQIPGQLAYWQRAAAGYLPNWDRVFAGYAACVDWPASRFWREIAAHFCDAKVLHSVRPADSWIDSVHAPERLLVYGVADGWAPLCAFLDVPVPDVAFPRSNSTAEFQARVAAMSIKA